MEAEVKEAEVLLDFSTIPVVDLHDFSQDEINVASQCSDVFRFDDIIVPKIDYSVFQESSASRKQTYSKLRLSRKQEGAETLPGYKAGHFSLSKCRSMVDESGKQEAQRILQFIQERLNMTHPSGNGSLFMSDGALDANNSEINLQAITRVDENCPQPLAVYSALHNEDVRLVSSEQVTDLVTAASNSAIDRSKKKLKPKEGARLKAFMNSNDASAHQIPIKPEELRSNGTTNFVDTVDKADNIQQYHDKLTRGNNVPHMANANNTATFSPIFKESIFPQLKRKFTTEPELHTFFNNIGGEWASKLKKRKIVNAEDFVTGLPQGWKLLLGVRKKNGRYIIECRKYISPAGLQFASWKEASVFLSTNGALPVGRKDVSQVNLDHANSRPHFDPIQKKDAHGTLNDRVDMPNASHQNQLKAICSPDAGKKSQEKSDIVAGTKRRYNPSSLNAPMNCKKCNATYPNRSSFMGHLTIHHVKRKKNAEGTPANSNSVTSLQVQANGTNNIPNIMAVQAYGQNMDNVAMVYDKANNVNSTQIQEDGANNVNSTQIQEDGVNNGKSALHIGNAEDMEKAPGEVVTMSHISSETMRLHTENMESSSTNGNRPHDANCSSMTDIKSPSNSCSKSFDEKYQCTVDIGVPESVDKQKSEKPNLFNFTSKNISADNNEQASISNPFLELLQEAAIEENFPANHGGFTNKPHLQYLKDQQNLSSENGKFDIVPDLGKVPMYMAEPKFTFGPGQNGNCPMEASSVLDIKGNSLQQVEFPSGQFGWDSFLPDRGAESSQFIVCIWCNTEFNHEGVDPDQQADSVGFICPVCKSKISGRIDVNNEA